MAEYLLEYSVVQFDGQNDFNRKVTYQKPALKQTGQMSAEARYFSHQFMWWFVFRGLCLFEKCCPEDKLRISRRLMVDIVADFCPPSLQLCWPLWTAWRWSGEPSCRSSLLLQKSWLSLLSSLLVWSSSPKVVPAFKSHQMSFLSSLFFLIWKSMFKYSCTIVVFPVLCVLRNR